MPTAKSSQESEDTCDRLRELRNRNVNRAAASHKTRVAADSVVSSAPLLLRQHQQLGVGCQYVAHGVLKLASGIDALLYIFDPGLGNVLDLLLAVHHER